MPDDYHRDKKGKTIGTVVSSEGREGLLGPCFYVYIEKITILRINTNKFLFKISGNSVGIVL